MVNFAVSFLFVWFLFFITFVLVISANSLTLLYVAMATETLARHLLMGTNTAIIATVSVPPVCVTLLKQKDYQKMMK